MQFAYVIRPGHKHYSIVEDLLDLVETKPLGVEECIKMLTDFYEQGHRSRFCFAMQGTALHELKSTTRGGERGGARIYFVWVGEDKALLLRGEVKEAGQTQPKASLINECARLYNLWRQYEQED